jgi:hypothetical protein
VPDTGREVIPRSNRPGSLHVVFVLLAHPSLSRHEDALFFGCIITDRASPYLAWCTRWLTHSVFLPVCCPDFIWPSWLEAGF